MPPKQAQSKKTAEKEKKKIIEDKTFGLKNKNKSKKVEAYIKSVTSQVNNRPADKRAEELAKQRKEEKAKAEEAKKELLELFKPVISQPKLPLGVDPKSVVCELFKHNLCTKGNKCKYSHDLAVERKSEKIDIYTDKRQQEEEDVMETWDAAKLESVVGQKRTEVNRNLKTKIVCKFFLDAVEQKKYGWFWECPNGGEKCQYVHALPPGFILKSKKVEVEDDEEPTPLEEIIEEQRKQLTTHTPVTLENFLKWKEEKKRKKEAARKAAEEKRIADIKAGKGVMSGRDLFVFNPEMFVDDDAALDIDDEELGENDEGEYVPQEVDGQSSQGYLGNDNEDSTTTTSAGDALAVEVNQSLFVDDDIPDEEEDEDEE